MTEDENRLKEYEKATKQQKNKHFFDSIKMSGKTLNFVEVEIKNKSHGSKQRIVLDSVYVNRIVMSDKFKRNDKSFKYFIGYHLMMLLDDDVCVLYIASIDWIYKIF